MKTIFLVRRLAKYCWPTTCASLSINVQDSYDLLTEREKEVFQLIAESKTNKNVAGLLNLSPHTVESHRANLMQKLGLHSTADIILYAVRRIIS